MTINSSYNPELRPINSSRVYTFNFQAITGTVYVFEVDADGVQTPASNISIVYNGNAPIYNGGQITFNTAHTAGTVNVLITRSTDQVQSLDLQPYSDFPAESVEFSLDRLTLIDQENTGGADIPWDLQALFAASGLVRGDYAALRAVKSDELLDGNLCFVVGAGIGGPFRLDKSDTVTTDNNGTVIVDAYGGRWFREFDGDVFVSWFEPSVNGLPGDGAKINTAIGVAKPLSANVRLGAGIYGVETTINLVDAKGVEIIGEGGGFFADSNANGIASTVLKWAGGASQAAIIRIRSEQSALSKATSGGVRGVMLDCNNQAGRGLYITSVNSYVFEDIVINDPTTTGLLMDCLDNKLNNGAPGGDPADNQDNFFDRISIKVDGTVPCIFLSGNAGDLATIPANTSLNYFGQIHLNIRDGDGFVFDFSDGNTVAMLRVFRPAGNTGVGLRFNADNAGNGTHARHNVLYHVQTGAAGVLAAAGNGTQPSDDNAILGFNYGNGGINNPPVVEAGATLSYVSPRLTKNIASQTVSIAGANDVSLAANAATQLEELSNESHRIFNGASNHSVYVDNSGNEWAVNIAATDGSFRIARVAGTGKLNLGAALDLTNQVVSSSATAGGASALPSTPSGYIDIEINGTTKKVPFYDV